MLAFKKSKDRIGKMQHFDPTQLLIKKTVFRKRGKLYTRYTLLIISAIVAFFRATVLLAADVEKRSTHCTVAGCADEADNC